MTARSPAPTPAPTRGPDWSCVPFDVACDRCGASLRGCEENACASCGLVFDWDDVVPVERLACLHCGYRLYGTSEQRCPECGEGFEWADVLDAARVRENDLFEGRWLRRPVRSLLHTWWLAAFRPQTLWTHFSLHDRPHIAPLVVFALLQAVVFYFGWDAAGAVVGPMINWVAAKVAPFRNFVYNMRYGGKFFVMMAVWYVFALGCFQLFLLAGEMNRVRWTHIVRVFVHSTALLALWPAFWCVYEAMLDSMLMVPGAQQFFPPPGFPSFYAAQQDGVFWAAATGTCLHIWIGCRYYLRIGRGWGIAAMSVLMGYLVARLVMLYF